MSQNTVLFYKVKKSYLFVNWLAGSALGVGHRGGGLNPGIHPQKRWKTVCSITDEQWMEEKRNAATGSLTVNVSFHCPHSVGVTGQLWHRHLWHLHTESTPCTPCKASSPKIYHGPPIGAMKQICLRSETHNPSWPNVNTNWTGIGLKLVSVNFVSPLWIQIYLPKATPFYPSN